MRHIKIETIETERLLIRNFYEDDWEDLYEYLSDEKIVYYEPYHIFSREACIQEAASRSVNTAFRAVCLKDSKKLIGNIYFHKQEFNTWMLGYVFNRKYHGQGYALESAKAVLDMGFHTLKARRVTALCNPNNTSSWKLLEKLGMRREGHLIENVYFKTDHHGSPIWMDTYEYGILSHEWNKQNTYIK